jgi:hypothetical protein
MYVTLLLTTISPYQLTLDDSLLTCSKPQHVRILPAKMLPITEWTAPDDDFTIVREFLAPAYTVLPTAVRPNS